MSGGSSGNSAMPPPEVPKTFDQAGSCTCPPGPIGPAGPAGPPGTIPESLLLKLMQIGKSV